MLWSEAKRELQKIDERELFRFIKSLYDNNPANKNFFEAALGLDNSIAIDIYKKEISNAVDPELFTPIELRRGRKAISDYCKAAPSNLFGQVDLMLHYVECGTNQTMKYGDIDVTFYNSMCSMIDRILKAAPKLGAADYARIVERFTALDARTRDKIGWGYSDHITFAAEELAQQKPTGD